VLRQKSRERGDDCVVAHNVDFAGGRQLHSSFKPDLAVMDPF